MNAQPPEAGIVSKLAYEVAQMSHLGLVRESNEDAMLVQAHALAEQHLAVVADGMGGHAGGETASRTIVSVFTERLEGPAVPNTVDDRLDWLVDGFFAAHERMADLALAEPALGQMGSTVLAALLGVDGVTYQYAGDSRMYWLRDGQVIGRSRDHSVVQALIDLGTLAESEAGRHPMAGALVSYIGAGKPIEHLQISPGTNEGAFFVPRPGDVVVLCTDGLWQEVPDAHLARLACDEGNSRERCERLVATALGAGGRDNLTVILASVKAGPSEGVDQLDGDGSRLPSAEDSDHA